MKTDKQKFIDMLLEKALELDDYYFRCRILEYAEDLR